MDLPTLFLTASHIIALPADGTVPEWVHLIPAGQFSGRDERGPYTLAADAVAQAFAGWGADLSIDYEHQSMLAPENGQPAPAAGWIKALESRVDGLWGQVEWTAKAAAMIAAREYRYLSPVFDYDKRGVVFRLLGAALTNNPNLYLTALNRREGFSSAHSQQGDIVELNELLERLRYMLNLPTLATPEEVLAELDKLKALLAQPETAAMRQTLNLSATAGLGDLLRAAHGRVGAAPDPAAYVPRGEFERVSHSLQQLQAAQDDERVDREVGAAMSAGKVAPASADWARDYCRRDAAGFALFVASAPVLIDGSGRASHAAQKPPAGDKETPLLADAKKRADKAAGKKTA